MHEPIEIRHITAGKEDYMDLLFLADEQQDMIDKYLYRGDLFALYQGDLKAVAVVTQEDTDTCELKNLATATCYQGQGYGRKMVEYLFGYYQGKYKTMLVATGDSPLTVPFYEHLGFVYSHRLPNYILEHYDHPIFEAGQQLTDLIYLKKQL